MMIDCDAIDWSKAPEGANAFKYGAWYAVDRESKRARQWLGEKWAMPGRLLFEDLTTSAGVYYRPDDDAPATTTQIGGDHYSRMAIQPIQYILANGIGYCEGNVIKYVSRYKAKGGVEDLRKARHYIDMLIEQEGEQ